MTPLEAISIIESLEKKFQVLKWQAHAWEAKLSNPDDTKTYTVKEPYDCRTEVIFDMIGGRYFVRTNCTREWGSSSSKWYSYINEQSFDGDVYWELKYERYSNVLPTIQDTPGFGIISKDRRNLSARGESVVEKYAFENGWKFMPPYITVPGIGYPAQRFSSLLKTWLDEGKDLKIVEEDAGVWIISVGEMKIGTLGHQHVRITYDMAKGGVVTSIKVLSPDANWEITMEGIRVEIDLQEVREGLWMPKMARSICPGDKNMNVVSFEVIEINPPTTSDTFRVHFPNGIYVTDYIKNKYYVMGGISNRPSEIKCWQAQYFDSDRIN